MPTHEGAGRERALAKNARKRADEKRRLAEASEGEERTLHEEAARSLDDSAAVHERLAEIYEQQERDAR
ncbi:MAG: hypothetical protein QOI95_3260 [Acidimicrobiaceae bacterium]|jgi:hypothetical protein